MQHVDTQKNHKILKKALATCKRALYMYYLYIYICVTYRHTKEPHTIQKIPSNTQKAQTTRHKALCWPGRMNEFIN